VNPRIDDRPGIAIATLTFSLVVILSSCGPPPGSPLVSENGCWVQELSSPPDITLTSEFQLVGGLPGDSVVLETVTDVVVQEDDLVLVVDGGAATVWVFGLDGKYLHRLGREGEGPGEFRYPFSAGVKTDGSVLVVDGSRWTVSVFDSSGFLDSAYVVEPQPPIGTVEIEVTDRHEIFTVGFHHFGASLSEGLGSKRKGLVRGEATLQQWNPAEARWEDRTELPGFEVFADVSQMKLVDVPHAGKGLWSVVPGAGLSFPRFGGHPTIEVKEVFTWQVEERYTRLSSNGGW